MIVSVMFRVILMFVMCRLFLSMLVSVLCVEVLSVMCSLILCVLCVMWYVCIL